MIVNMAFKHTEPSDQVKSYAIKRSEKLKKYFNGRICLSWSFESEKQNHTAHCHLTGKHIDYFGEASTETFYSAIDFVIDKIERQVKKHKEIVKDHHYKDKKKLRRA